MNTVVVKIGSNIITSDKGLDEDRIARIAEEIASLYSRGYATVIVSSGAVAAGRAKLGIQGPIQEITLKQAAAAVGQSSLMRVYERIFDSFNRKVAQVLLTRDVFSDRKRYLNARNTVTTLLSLDVTPVINENDTVSIDELKFGDNDHLAALVATLLDVQHLVILSDVDGLYTEDPRKNSAATLIPRVAAITPEIEAGARGAGSMVGTGGMFSKLMAARIAVANGIGVNIVNGREEGLLTKAVSGAGAGTFFEPEKKRRNARKGWIASGIHAKGVILIDSGAIDALLIHGKSLLPSGIKAVEGDFEQGDAVYVVSLDGAKVAKGLVNYGASELQKILGRKTSQIEETLGYKYSDEVVHRDNMTLLTV